MHNDKNDNVINLFQKSKHNAENGNLKLFKGFPYVKLLKDENGNLFKEESLLEYADRCFYIVSAIKKNGINAVLYKYKVPFDSLFDFLKEFKQNESYGKVIDIERYIPEDLA